MVHVNIEQKSEVFLDFVEVYTLISIDNSNTLIVYDIDKSNKFTSEDLLDFLQENSSIEGALLVKKDNPVQKLEKSIKKSEK